jgi:anaerobic selenocysteine-containing dehydrogenase
MARQPLYEATPEAAARIIARHLGYTGREGGWLYDQHGRHVVQGYAALARRYARAIMPRRVTDPRTGELVTRYAISWTELPR